MYIGGLLIFSVTSLACALSNSFADVDGSSCVPRVWCGCFGKREYFFDPDYLSQTTFGTGNGHQRIGGCRVGGRRADDCGRNFVCCLLAVVVRDKCSHCNRGVDFIFSFLPVNPVKRSGRKFDWISGLMNAFTFGLLIFSIEGFTHGMSLSILLPGIGVVLLVGYFFVRRQLSQEYPLLPVDLLKIPIFFVVCGTSVCSFVAQMLAMVSLPFFCSTRWDWMRWRRIVADPLAVSDDDCGSFGGEVDRAGSCRVVRGGVGCRYSLRDYFC